MNTVLASISLSGDAECESILNDESAIEVRLDKDPGHQYIKFKLVQYINTVNQI